MEKRWKIIELKIDASELKREGKEVIQNLADFIKNKSHEKVDVENKIINISIENEKISKDYMRTLVKQFLHKSKLKEYYRVLRGNEDTLIVKERKIYEE